MGDDRPLVFGRAKPDKFDVYWNRAMGIIAVIALAMVLVVVIVVLVLNTEGSSFQRYCLDNPNYRGQLPISSNERTIEWNIDYTLAPMDVVTALHIYGPVMPGMTDGPLLIAICGVPSSLACDTSVSSVLSGKIGPTHEGNSLKVPIQDIRSFPRRYYIELITSMNTTGLRAYLGTICGTTG